jgi:YesN/AraC family two-component response regulator
MVCNRCIMVVRNEIEKAGFHPVQVELGEVQIQEDPDKNQVHDLDKQLRQFGFELIDDRKSRTIEKIKNIIVKLVHHSEDNIHTNLSDYISSEINQEYNYISNLFSEIEGTTIEKYFISQKIEKIKELLVYDELSISEIADKLGYSSVAYLSNQFKKHTGLTPSYYKSLKEHKRNSISEL